LFFLVFVVNCKWVCTWWQWYYNTQKRQNHTYTRSKQYTKLQTQCLTYSILTRKSWQFELSPAPVYLGEDVVITCVE
jgi:hypothetical protein